VASQGVGWPFVFGKAFDRWSPIASEPMTGWPLAAYDAALAGDGHVLRDEAGRQVEVGRWCGDLVPGDRGLVERSNHATLDVGCGPGRLAAAVAWRELPVLGIDVSLRAVILTRARGVSALCRSVFDPLPGTGRWGTVLLADGNLGIGGDPARLLDRVRDLLAPDGQALVEVEPPGTDSTSTQVRFESGNGEESPWVPWAWVAADDLAAVAAEAGLVIGETWQEAGRWFATCVPSAVVRA
jgi:SAM-dependent methyltransferase